MSSLCASTNPTSVPHSLRVKALFADFGLVAVGAMFVFSVIAPVSGPLALWWSAGFLAALIPQLAVLHGALAKNRQSHAPERVCSEFGLANHITIARAWLNAGCFAFAFIPVHHAYTWYPLAFYLSSLLLDFVDGYVARITRRESEMGTILEHEFDSIGVIAAAAAGWSRGALGPIFLLVAPARYLYIAAERVRLRRGLPMQPLRYSISGRVIAGLFMGFLCVALIPGFPVLFLRVAAPIFLIPFVGGFLRDWLTATGTLSTESAFHHTAAYVLRVLMIGWVPVAARVCAAAFLVAIATSIGGIAMLLLCLSALMLSVGFAARSAAVVAIGVLAYMALPVLGAAPLLLVSVALCGSVLVLGSGYYTVAAPEEYPFATRIGS